METFKILSINNAVIGEANFRLPFEPKLHAKEYRDRLRDEIRKLDISNDTLLKATLKTSNKQFFDVENVLFYNLGTSCFKKCSVNGVFMEYEELDNGLTYHKYSISNINDILDCKRDAIAQLEFNIDKMNTSSKPFEYWFASHNGSCRMAKDKWRKNEEFGLFIKIISNREKYNIVNLIKPMVDGVIARFHSDINLEANAIQYLCDTNKCEKMKLTEFLMNKNSNLLGERNLLKTYRSGVMWNPEDELCKELLIIPIKDQSSGKIKIEVELYKLSKDSNV